MNALVVLERVVEDFVPDYSVYGVTACYVCESMVYVGHETARVLAEGLPEEPEQVVLPVCIQCASKHVPEGQKPFSRVDDGACPNCGGMHRP